MSPSKVQIRIANPAPNGRAYTSLERAREYERSGAGYFMNGKFVFRRGDDQERKLRRLRMCHLRDSEPSPDLHGVMPVSPEWLHRMGY